MSALHVLAVLAAGLAAGAINTVVGSGSLITFPTLVALGYPPVVANVSNTVGLVPGSVTGAIGYRAELRGQRARLLRLGLASLLGAVTGGLLLLRLPESVFQVVVPVLIIGACVLVIAQPRLNRWLAARRGQAHPHGGPWLLVGVFASGVYGGYFGAAQGVILIGLLGLLLDETLQRVNGAKNVLAGLVNAAAAVLFVVVGDVAWLPAGLIAVGAILGGVLGASVGRRLPPLALRVVVVAVGVVAAVVLIVR